MAVGNVVRVTRHLLMWAGNNLPFALGTNFDLTGLVAIISIRHPARGVALDFRSDDPGSGVTIDVRVDEAGMPLDPPGEMRCVRWHYDVSLTRTLPRYETMSYELELRDGSIEVTVLSGNLIVQGGANADD